jgi:hypothetical protein
MPWTGSSTLLDLSEGI